MSEDMVAAARATLAAALRYQAMTLRSQAELAVSQATLLDQQAAGIEDGTLPVPTRPVRLQVVDEEPEENGAGPVLSVEALLLNEAPGGRLHWTSPDGGPVSEAMLEWLTQFDERHTRRTSAFVAAVNIAADEEMPLDNTTARFVADKADELRAREDAG